MAPINSMLDDDLYKLTMCQAVCQKFPYAHARYEFINRGQHTFRAGFANSLKKHVELMKRIRLEEAEAYHLGKVCPFLTPVFIDFLKGYRYNPEEVVIEEGDCGLDIVIEGLWYRTILWEVKLMAMISQLYLSRLPVTPERIEDAALAAGRKGGIMAVEGLKFADFGTRRRYSWAHHMNVVNALYHNSGANFVGTSNVGLAIAHKIKPIGTQAHEWFMFHGAKYGYKQANQLALKHWAEVYHGNLGIALSDTFTSDAFFSAFGTKYARLFDGVRHDSGDPVKFAIKAIQHYQKLGIDPMTKTIVFSDNLNVDKAINLYRRFKNDIRVSFGIGTNLTNDIDGIEPLNMVIKMTACKPYGVDEWLPVVKLSDVPTKHTGDREEIELCKRSLGLH